MTILRNILTILTIGTTFQLFGQTIVKNTTFIDWTGEGPVAIKIIEQNKIDNEITRKAIYKTGFASDGVTCKHGALCFYSSSVLADSFVLRNPPERKVPHRYIQPKEP